MIPNKGNQTQKIPPNTSVKESRVNSAAGKYFDLAEYNISPEQTKKPCNAESDELFNETKTLSLVNKITQRAKIEQNIPATATVVNLGVFFLHLRETVNPAKPNDESKPLISPNKVPSICYQTIERLLPMAAIDIAIKVVKEIFSFKKTCKLKIDAINGIAASMSIEIAAVVVVIERIKVIIPMPRHTPPIKPDRPTLK